MRAKYRGKSQNKTGKKKTIKIKLQPFRKRPPPLPFPELI